MTAVLVAAALLSACGKTNGPQAPTDQRACFSKILDDHVRSLGYLADQRMKAIQSGSGLAEVTLAAQHERQAYCSQAALCAGLKDSQFGAYVESCMGVKVP